jgi:hypothetical protein
MTKRDTVHGGRAMGHTLNGKPIWDCDTLDLMSEFEKESDRRANGGLDQEQIQRLGAIEAERKSRGVFDRR